MRPLVDRGRTGTGVDELEVPDLAFGHGLLQVEVPRVKMELGVDAELRIGLRGKAHQFTPVFALQGDGLLDHARGDAGV